MAQTLAEKIRIIRTSLGLKQDEFAEKLNTTQGTVSRWERGSKPEFEFLVAISELGGVNLHQLVGSFAEEARLGEVIEPRAKAIDTGEVVPIQKLDLSLSMGPGTLIDDYVEAVPVNFDLAFIQAITRAPVHRLKLVTGIGDSMYPTLNWGDAIMIDTTDNALAKQDGIYWINLYGAAGLKRLRTVAPGRVLVKSDNPTVGDQEVDAQDLRIEGRAIWVARGL